jgi:hypothetical protein
MTPYACAAANSATALRLQPTRPMGRLAGSLIWPQPAMNLIRILFSLPAAFIIGCAAPKPASNPLVGWTYCFSGNPIRSNETVKADYQGYIEQLSRAEKNNIGSIDLFGDETGQHAARIVVNLNGTRWAHILFYDQQNKRTKVIKYATGMYRS